MKTVVCFLNQELYHVCGLASSIYLYTDVEIITQQVVWFVYAFYNRKKSGVYYDKAHTYTMQAAYVLLFNNGLRSYTFKSFYIYSKIFSPDNQRLDFSLRYEP